MVCERRFRVWLRTDRLVLGYRSNMRWRLRIMNMSDLYYGCPKKKFFHLHEGVRVGPTWRHLSRTFSILLGHNALKVSKLLWEELRASFWNSSVRNSFWTMTLCQLLRWNHILLLGSLLYRARFRWVIYCMLWSNWQERHVRGWPRGRYTLITWWCSPKIFEQIQWDRMVYRHGH